jgi:predicted phosphodiesterase
MKQKESTKKLSFKKETVAHLTPGEMSGARGGESSVICVFRTLQTLSIYNCTD